MQYLADISLFESVTNQRLHVFNDAFTDVVAESDPLMSHEERVGQLIAENPIEESGNAVVGNILEKVEPEIVDDGTKSAARSIYGTIGCIKKVVAFTKTLTENMDDEKQAAIARAFVKKYDDKIRSICDYANDLKAYFSQIQSPKKHISITAIGSGGKPSIIGQLLRHGFGLLGDRLF